MNLTKSFKRNSFVEVDRFSSKINSSHQQKTRCCRDPFEGDPFKIQSLNFRYAEKPGYPVSNRGKGVTSGDKSQVKDIYYNHDHTIPKCNKENLPPGHSRQLPQLNPIRKSSSVRSIAVTSKSFSAEKGISGASAMSQQLNRDSQLSILHRRRSSMTRVMSAVSSVSQQPSRESDFSITNRARSSTSKDMQLRRSKPCICIPSMSSKSCSGQSRMASKSMIGPSLLSTSSTTTAPVQKRSYRSRSDLSTDPMTDIDVNHSGSCHVTIKINGVPKNRVHVAKNRNNVEINLVKPKKLKKPKSPKTQSPHSIKPSRSFVIHRDQTTSDVGKSSPSRRESSRNAMKDSSTLSMVPHREEKCTSQETNMTNMTNFTNLTNMHSSMSDRTRNYSSDVPRSTSRTTIPNRILGNHAAMLEKILSNNPIVLQPKGRIIFTRSQSGLAQRCSSTAIPNPYTFGNINSKAC